MKLKYIQDFEEAKQYLKKDELYKNIYGLDIDNWKKIIGEDVLVGVHNNQEVGVFVVKLYPGMNVCFHGGIYKEHRGANSLRYFKKALKILKRQMYPLHLFTMVPEHNKPAVRLVEAVGLKYKKTIEADKIQYKVFQE